MHNSARYRLQTVAAEWSVGHTVYAGRATGCTSDSDAAAAAGATPATTTADREPTATSAVAAGTSEFPAAVAATNSHAALAWTVNIKPTIAPAPGTV